MEGKIVRLFDRGYGFIKPEGSTDDGNDLFFHASDVNGTTFNELKVGDDVTFEVSDGPKGKNATNISLK